MRDTIKSVLSFTWSLSLFGARQVLNLLSPKEEQGEKAAASFDAVTRAAAAQIDPPWRNVHEMGERVQQGLLDWLFGSGPGGVSPQPDEVDTNVEHGQLDPSRFVVLGDGLAAGTSDFGLKEDLQRQSFPALVARRMGASFAQALFEPPGVGDVPGLPRLPVRAPAMMQTTVRRGFPAAEPPDDLSIPGLTWADVLEVRPTAPVVHRHDAKQTAVNLVLGTEQWLLGLPGETAGLTPFEAAVAKRPTFALVALGFSEALDAAADPGRLASPTELAGRVGTVVRGLRGAGAEVVVATIPDPLDTPFLSTVEAAGALLRVEPRALATTYGLAQGDRITVSGLYELGGQILGGATHPLSPGSVVPGGVAATLSSRLAELNRTLSASAREEGARVFDLHALLHAVAERGVTVAGRHLSAGYLGGLYSLNGCMPGRTGHALIANALLAFLNEAYGARFRLTDLARVAAIDPVTRQHRPQGPLRTELPPPVHGGIEGRQTARPLAADGGSWPPSKPKPSRLTLPPGLRQVLPLAKRASYHGDAIRIVDCPEERDQRFGSSGDLFFGGFVLYDSHLAGDLHFRFAPPVDDVSHFEISLGPGLAADDGVLAAPQLFRWPVVGAKVTDAPGLVSAGDLHLATGDVANLQVNVLYLNSALFGLTRANPNFPKVPIVFPGQYGSAWARFSQRPDGLLDFTFYGSTFLPLGGRFGADEVVWALPFASPTQDFAHLPARGFAMHPHLHLSTCETTSGAERIELPCNTLHELTLFAQRSSFGDLFTLEADELGGEAKGRSHVTGRLEVQIGERFGDSVSVAISSLHPGGMLVPPGPSPLHAAFPGRLYAGPVGHNEFLRFPLRTYYLDAVSFLDDPFDLTAGAVDLASGVVINQVLRRGFIAQDLFYSLVRFEPRTPQSSFFFRGPARLERNAGGRLVFRLNSEVHIPYPPGFLFPAPDLATGMVIQPGSALDPFLWMHALEEAPARAFSAEGTGLRSSTHERFSYRAVLPADPTCHEAVFEYTNDDEGGTFRLTRLAWLGFIGSDTATFSGFGTWSKDGGKRLHVAAVQLAPHADPPYVSIQIDGGAVSNVNLKPIDERFALP